MIWDWEDGTSETYEDGHLQMWPAGQVVHRSHAFMQANDFLVNVTIRNSFNVETFVHYIRVYNMVRACYTSANVYSMVRVLHSTALVSCMLCLLSGSKPDSTLDDTSAVPSWRVRRRLLVSGLGR